MTAVSAAGYMLGNPVYPFGTRRPLWVGSDNPTVCSVQGTAPENQQERLAHAGENPQRPYASRLSPKERRRDGPDLTAT